MPEEVTTAIECTTEKDNEDLLLGETADIYYSTPFLTPSATLNW